MSHIEHEGVGKVWWPERKLSLPGKPVIREHYGVVVAHQTKLKGEADIRPLVPEFEHPLEGQTQHEIDKWRGEFAPEKFERETVWASVTHNARVDMGASITANRLFGTVGTTNLGVFTNIGVGGSGGVAPSFGTTITVVRTDLSLGIITASVSTNEATTVGLPRAVADSIGTFTAASVLDGNASLVVQKTFTLSGAAIIFSAGLFDQAVVAGSHLYCEDNFSTTATLANTDSLVVSWTLSQ